MIFPCFCFFPAQKLGVFGQRCKTAVQQRIALCETLVLFVFVPLLT